MCRGESLPGPTGRSKRPLPTRGQRSGRVVESPGLGGRHTCFETQASRSNKPPTQTQRSAGGEEIRLERLLQLVSLLDREALEVNLVLATGPENHAPAYGGLKKVGVTCVGPEPRTGPVRGEVRLDGSVVNQMPGKVINHIGSYSLQPNSISLEPRNTVNAAGVAVSRGEPGFSVQARVHPRLVIQQL